MNILILEIGNFEEFKSRWHYFWNIWPREITYFKFYSSMTSIWKIVQFYYFINILDACEYNNISLFICSLKESLKTRCFHWRHYHEVGRIKQVHPHHSKASQVQVELNHNISLSIHDDHHGGSTEGAGGIRRQGLTPGESPTRSGGRSRRGRRHWTATPVKKCGILKKGVQKSIKNIDLRPDSF